MSRITTLALVRHGESEWIVQGRFQGHSDPPLSDVGMRQAAAVGARLADPSGVLSLPVPAGPPAAVWHSPLRRAAQTAEAIHQARGGDAPLRQLAELIELSQGAWEGLTHDEVRRRWPAELAAWRADPLRNHAPGGEALEDARARAHGAARTILEPGDPGGAEWAIVVAHDGVLRLLLLDLLGIGTEHFWSFPLALASVSVVDLGGEVAQLRAHNLDEHVSDLNDPSADRTPGQIF